MTYPEWVAMKPGRPVPPAPAPRFAPPVPWEVLDHFATAPVRPTIASGTTETTFERYRGIADWPIWAHIGMFFAAGSFWLIAVETAHPASVTPGSIRPNSGDWQALSRPCLCSYLSEALGCPS